MDANKKLRNIFLTMLESINVKVESKNGMPVLKRGKRDILADGKEFVLYEQGFENNDWGVHYFNPVTENPLKGHSASLLMLKHNLSTKISSSTLITLVSIYKMIGESEDVNTKSLSVLPKGIKFKKKYEGELRKIIANMNRAGTQAYTMNIVNNHTYKGNKYIMATTLSSNIIETLEGYIETGWDELGISADNIKIYLYGIKKIMPEGTLGMTNEGEWSSYDAVARGYNLATRRINGFVKGFKDYDNELYKVLHMTKVHEAEDFKELKLPLKRIPELGGMNDELEPINLDDFDELAPDIPTGAVNPMIQAQQTQSVQPNGIVPAGQMVAAQPNLNMANNGVVPMETHMTTPMVTNIATPTTPVVKETQYDAFGRVIEDDDAEPESFDMTAIHQQSQEQQMYALQNQGVIQNHGMIQNQGIVSNQHMMNPMMGQVQTGGVAMMNPMMASPGMVNPMMGGMQAGMQPRYL